MIHLETAQWNSLYKQIQAIAYDMTWTKNKALEHTAKDRADEAVQGAFDRYFRVSPPEVQTMDQLRIWLSWRVRSQLSRGRVAEGRRRVAEKAATVEQETVSPAVGPSPETMQLDAGAAQVKRVKSERLIRYTRAYLEEKGDTLTLSTMDFIAKEIDSPERQAELLGVEVEEIYNARKRRNRAMQHALAKIQAEDDEEKE